MPFNKFSGKAKTICPPIVVPIMVPKTKDVIHVYLIWRHIMVALEKFELTCITACTGIIAIGGIKDAIIDINIAPPPRPKAADITDVKKLETQSTINAHSEIPVELDKKVFRNSMISIDDHT